VTGDCHGQINSTIFEKLMEEKLIPNVSKKSVVVFDNAPYHSIQVDKPSSKYAVKADMISWLRRQVITCNGSMRKHQLYILVDLKRPKENAYRIDQLLNACGP
jgi:hypothetical protein